ncbi:MAG: hypothetical protein A2W31_11425 [Planctomycetes bacterium RBG_16_64_10]|nr:MAG: hypothetical protein A2W31_11425 [Planctomycetes bacterium RBG_16_64_10]
MNLHLTDVPITDTDHWIWTVASGSVVGLVAGLSLWLNYRQGFEVPADLKTVSYVCAAYFAASLTKRIARMKQRQKREAGGSLDAP